MMKHYYYYLFAALFLGLFFSACEEEQNPVDTGGGKGTLIVQSAPVLGAQIWINGQNTGRVTPDTISNVDAGSVSVTLKLTEYRDTTVTVNLTDGQTRSILINLTSSLSFSTYTDTLWETTGTTAAQPSGLDLSAGVAVSTTNPVHDILYSSSGFVIRSSTSRGTSFMVGTGTDLDDGVNSPLATSSWANNVGDREDNYFFLFDQDLHYSKMKIVDWGGGSGLGDPAWVIVEWHYNNSANDTGF